MIYTYSGLSGLKKDRNSSTCYNIDFENTVIKKQRHYFADKGPCSQSYGFSSSHIWIWELNHKEGWTSKNWCFWTVVLEKTVESPLECKETEPVNPKGNHSWIFTGRTDAEAKVPILQPLDAKRRFIRKDLDAGKDWRQEEKGMTEDEMVGWNHWLNEHEFEQAPGDGEGYRSLACCSPWGHKELDTTEQQQMLIEMLVPQRQILYDSTYMKYQSKFKFIETGDC